MATDKNREKESPKEDKQKQILDFAEAWKKMYFDSEATLAKAIDEYVAGDSFTSFLEKMGAEYLSFYKTNNQNMERFFANSPVPSKKDIARVAELVINIEEKVENLDMGMSAGFNSFAENMMRLVEFQAVLKDEIISLRQDVQALHKQLQSERPLASTGDGKPVSRTRSRKTESSSPQEDINNAVAKNDADTNAGDMARPRTRKKSTDKS